MTQGNGFLPLVPGEVQITDTAELLWRQCAPGHFDRRTGKPTADIFRPTDEDKGMMSVARKTKATAKGSYEHRTVTLGKRSEGTWAVSVGEVEAVGSRAVDDTANQPNPPPAPAPGHSYIDVRHLEELHRDKTEKMRFRSTLLIHANKRNRQHPQP
jgi:hypothetical protein